MKKKIVIFVLRILIVVIIYALIFRRISISNVKSLLTPVFCIALLICVALNLIQAAICTRRWIGLAGNAPNVPGFVPSYAAYLEGLFFNQALPSFVGGDAVRALRWRAFGVSTHDAIVSIIRDRLFGAIGAAVLGLWACVMLLDSPLNQYEILFSLALSAAVMLGGIGLVFAMQSKRVARVTKRFPRIHAALLKVSASPLGTQTCARSCLNALVGQALSGISVYLLARSIGIEISFLLLVTITGIILVVSMIPISLAGWGVREASFLALLVPLGASSESVILLGVSFGMAGLLGGLLGGISMIFGMSAPKFPQETPAEN